MSISPADALVAYDIALERAMACGLKRPENWMADLDVSAAFYDELEMELNFCSAARTTALAAGADVDLHDAQFNAAIRLCRTVQDVLVNEGRLNPRPQLPQINPSPSVPPTPSLAEPAVPTTAPLPTTPTRATPTRATPTRATPTRTKRPPSMSPSIPRLVLEVLITTPRPPGSSGPAMANDGPSARTRTQTGQAKKKGPKSKSSKQPIPAKPDQLESAPISCTDCQEQEHRDVVCEIRKDTKRRSCERCYLRKKPCSFSKKKGRKAQKTGSADPAPNESKDRAGATEEAAEGAADEEDEQDEDEDEDEEGEGEGEGQTDSEDENPDDADFEPTGAAEIKSTAAAATRSASPMIVDVDTEPQNSTIASGSNAPAGGPSVVALGKRRAEASPPASPMPSGSFQILENPNMRSNKRVRIGPTNFDDLSIPHINSIQEGFRQFCEAHKQPELDSGASHTSEFPHAVYLEGDTVRFRKPSFGLHRNGIGHAAQTLISNANQLQVFAYELGLAAEGLAQDASRLFALANDYGVDWVDVSPSPAENETSAPPAPPAASTAHHATRSSTRHTSSTAPSRRSALSRLKTL
ncbi:hypothetical protein SCHPADRAFT_946107 [Schizopora paradoxa]|uniref:Uncharacterized protein n=1 Tax=Schizopora paradoxa TaxID=27342 RepID=A0A0H2RNL5_9AGAM|nr:hypothetical protein SCHPADRAFT_946107 [Schizopora paradoxa]